MYSWSRHTIDDITNYCAAKGIDKSKMIFAINNHITKFNKENAKKKLKVEKGLMSKRANTRRYKLF